LIEVKALTEDFAEFATGEIIKHDGVNIVLVFVACTVSLMFYTQSAFLAFLSFSNVMMSIPITLHVYKMILGVRYLSTLHLPMLVVLVVIGSNHILVFHDSWENGLRIKALHDKFILRLSYTWRKAAVQMFVSSITSAFAFYTCTEVPVMAIRSLGVFCSTLSMICFLITILSQPIIYFIYEKYFKDVMGNDERLNFIIE
jgi:hypothetical protein